MILTFFVPGIPKPGGSKRGFLNRATGRVNIVDACKKSRDWKAVVADCASQAAFKSLIMTAPLTIALKVTVLFTLPRPRGHYGQKGLKASARRYPTVKPDLLKLMRSTEDACTGIIWRDDAQVVKEVLEKAYGEQPGAQITVETLE